LDHTEPLSALPLDGAALLLNFQVVDSLSLVFDLSTIPPGGKYFGFQLNGSWTDIVNSYQIPASTTLIDVHSQLHPSAPVAARIAGEQLDVATGWFVADNPDRIQFTNLLLAFSWPLADPNAPDEYPGPVEFVSADIDLFVGRSGVIGVSTIPEPEPLAIWSVLGACVTGACYLNRIFRVA
jgi:hypothetical protein